jgi:hypothetical protein
MSLKLTVIDSGRSYAEQRTLINDNFQKIDAALDEIPHTLQDLGIIMPSVLITGAMYVLSWNGTSFYLVQSNVVNRRRPSTIEIQTYAHNAVTGFESAFAENPDITSWTCDYPTDLWWDVADCTTFKTYMLMILADIGPPPIIDDITVTANESGTVTVTVTCHNPPPIP